ncbi:MAG: response regulator, partial [Chloroflexi bacterium]|nr:response regulator [Chloroflexota bacterium]
MESADILLGRVAHDLRRKIVGGIYRDGQRLALRRIATEYGVDVPTVRRAIDVLQRGGFAVRRAGAGATARRESGARRGILVVDDEQSICELVSRALGDQWDVMSAGSGNEALECLEERAFSLVFLDLAMPDMDGAELFRVMRARGLDCPVAILTAYLNSALLAKVLESGPVVLLLKPFDLQELRESVRR